MSDYIEQAHEIEQGLVSLNRMLLLDEVARQYPGDADVLKKDLQNKLARIRADIGHLEQLQEDNFFPGNPIFDDQRLLVMKDIAAIGVALEFDINPKLTTAAQTLLSKAKEAPKDCDRNLLKKAKDTLDAALKDIADPVIKLAALLKAFETIQKLFQGPAPV